jgi:hypothetical protein
VDEKVRSNGEEWRWRGMETDQESSYSVVTTWFQKLQADKLWLMLRLVASDDSAIAEPWFRYKKRIMVSRPVFWRLEDIIEYDMYSLKVFKQLFAL